MRCEERLAEKTRRRGRGVKVGDHFARVERAHRAMINDPTSQRRDRHLEICVRIVRHQFHLHWRGELFRPDVVRNRSK